MWTPDFVRFVAPARRRPELWRLAVGIVLAAVLYAGVVVAMLLGVSLLAGPDGAYAWLGRIALAQTPTAVLLTLGTFAGMAAGVVLAARLVQRRDAASLLGEGAGAHFLGAALICAGVAGLAALALPRDFPLIPNTPPNLFLSFLPAALLGLVVQTGAEEVLFRGYLQTQLAARFASPLVWMVVPSALFGLAHYDPAGAGANAWWLVGATGLFGLIAADLTRVTGSIGAAWGLHFVNNAVAVLLISLDGSLSGLSLWKTPFGALDTATLRPLLVQDMILSVIVWACIRLWLAGRDDAAGAGGRERA